MKELEDVIDECLRLFGGRVVQVRYSEQGKKRLLAYLKWCRAKRRKKEGTYNMNE